MQPLAERLRPRTLDEYIGQRHLVGPGAVLRGMIETGRVSLSGDAAELAQDERVKKAYLGA